ncbi:DsrH/TusB family sulfur metabolism protein [Marinospirillum sp. MEB164]|uniref:DsrH/TusB family sulfur metabolism protein n=1 Tax=Marinospirillum alkalitolerans TaxID=3123374 RepID=A0ABW8PX62_9GAMM
MPSLHQINHPHKLAQALPLMQAEDAIVLVEQGVNLLQQPIQLTQPLYALKKDCQARAITPHATCTLIDHAQWVALTLEYDRVCSW